MTPFGMPQTSGIDPVIAQALALGQGSVGPIGQTQTVSQPFTWGAGGRKLTPQQLAFEQKLAASKSQSDYSPVSNIWQGLGRVTDNITGALESRSLDKQSAQMQADRDAQIAALLGPGNADLAGAFAGGDEVAASLAGDIFKSRTPKPVNNDTANDYQFYESMLGEGKGRQFLENQLDPIVNIPLPGGRVYVGPRSGIASATGGGDPTSVPAPPAQLPPDFDFGGPTPPASGGFR